MDSRSTENIKYSKAISKELRDQLDRLKSDNTSANGT